MFYEQPAASGFPCLISAPSSGSAGWVSTVSLSTCLGERLPPEGVISVASHGGGMGPRWLVRGKVGSAEGPTTLAGLQGHFHGDESQDPLVASGKKEAQV